MIDGVRLPVVRPLRLQSRGEEGPEPLQRRRSRKLQWAMAEEGAGGGFSSGEGEDLRGAMGPASEDRTLDGVGGDDPAADVACGLGKKTTIQEDQSDQ